MSKAFLYLGLILIGSIICWITYLTVKPKEFSDYYFNELKQEYLIWLCHERYRELDESNFATNPLIMEGRLALREEELAKIKDLKEKMHQDGFKWAEIEEIEKKAKEESLNRLH